MSKSNVIKLEGREASADPLTELPSTGACQLIQHAVEAELQESLATHADRQLADGRAGVVRNDSYRELRSVRRGQSAVPAISARCHQETLAA